RGFAQQFIDYLDVFFDSGVRIHGNYIDIIILDETNIMKKKYKVKYLD
ncbi:MAG: hypothetical protein H8E87_05410, partial [FCB group bacterium]|nr:hypothetical protein [FCB group bacterium]